MLTLLASILAVVAYPALVHVASVMHSPMLAAAATLVLAALNSAEYRELAKAQVFRDTVRALPALSNGRLYVRDGSTLKCLDLSAQP